MSTLAAVRPDSWNFPLFVHIVGVVLLVGGLVTAASFLGYARGDTGLCGSATGHCSPSPFPGTS